MFKQSSLVLLIGLIVAVVTIRSLQSKFLVGPVVLLLGLVPITGILLARRRIKAAVPDLVFGSIDTGLLVIPAIGGGLRFGLTGAIVGGVVGDALTDAVAGFFEGGVAKWLRTRGIDESRDPLTTSLGKMSGCLLGGGAVLTAAALFGLNL